MMSPGAVARYPGKVGEGEVRLGERNWFARTKRFHTEVKKQKKT